MKIYKNINYPLKIRKIPTDSENINIWNYRDVIYNRSVDISSLDVDSTSSVTFTEPLKAKIPNLTVNSGELLLIDMDCVIMDEVRIANGGEMRII